MSWWQWSKTAGNNATADPSINWAEGQSPSSINDSARAMMAVIAQFRDDTSGLLVTTGTASAYAVATNQGLPATPNNGQLVAISPNLTNGVGVTLTADGGNIYPIQSTPGTAVGSAVMLAGTPYMLKFNAAVPAWILMQFIGNPYNIPLGGVLFSTINLAPNSNFAFANGQAISRTTYAAYFAAVGTLYGTGDGTTTFNIPDIMARAVFGLDAMGGAPASNRITSAAGNFNAAAVTTGGAQTQIIGQGNLPAVNFPNSGISINDGGHAHSIGIGNSAGAGGGLATSVGGTQSGAYIETSNSNVSIGSQGSAASGGSGTPLPVVPPAITLPIFVRIF